MFIHKCLPTCKGCIREPVSLAFFKCNIWKIHEEASICPCRDCIVKSMCSYACDEYVNISLRLQVERFRKMVIIKDQVQRRNIAK